MAKGLPVVATAVNGIPEALGDAGCLLAGRERAQALFREAPMVERYLRVIQRALASADE